MRNTLQEQYNLIKEGKGAKDVFVKHAKSLFPHLVPNHYGFDTAAQILTQRGIISENVWGIATGNNQQPDWFKLFNESLENENKADAKTPAKEVEEYEEKSYDNQYGAETGDDVIFDQYLNGIQIEICNPKNADKSVAELKKIVLKNLKKDKLYYTKNAAFGVEGIGYTEDAPGLGKTKEVKGKYASSGMEPVKLKESINEGNLYHNEEWSLEPEGPHFILTYQAADGKKEKVFNSEPEAKEWIKNNLNEVNMEEYIVWIQPEGEEKREHHRAKSKPEAERIARMVYGNYYDDYNPPKIGIMPASEWSQETSLDMNIQESKLRSAIRSLIKEELNLKEIDQVGEDASKEAKIRKINEEINKRKKKLKALETLKELEEDSVNPKKIKELYSEIKKLEAAKNKLEKKGKKKEALVDEIAVVDKTTTSDEMADIAKQEKTTPAAVKKAVDTAKASGEPVTVA